MHGMPVTLLIYNTVNAGDCKQKMLEELGQDQCIGNGNNDRLVVSGGCAAYCRFGKRGAVYAVACGCGYTGSFQ